MIREYYNCWNLFKIQTRKIIYQKRVIGHKSVNNSDKKEE